VGLRDLLLGRSKLKEASTDELFALSTARVTLETELGLRPAGRAGICFKPLSAGEFAQAESELAELLTVAARDSGSRVSQSTDEHGFQWIVVEDPELEDLITTVHLVGSDLAARGFGAQLLAALFRFEGRERPVYWIYGYKRAAFWPFVPTGKGQERDNAEELALKAQLEGELPVEQDLTRWLGLFGAPV
jgi:hypothetical protein